MNPKLKKGDRVLLLYMSGESGMFPGECGTVTSVDNVFGDIQYGVKWDNGSSLALLSDTDAWKLEKKQIKENELDRMNVLYKNLDVFEFFKIFTAYDSRWYEFIFNITFIDKFIFQSINN
jgi:hypothetical protein